MQVQRFGIESPEHLENSSCGSSAVDGGCRHHCTSTFAHEECLGESLVTPTRKNGDREGHETVRVRDYEP